MRGLGLYGVMKDLTVRQPYGEGLEDLVTASTLEVIEAAIALPGVIRKLTTSP